MTESSNLDAILDAIIFAAKKHQGHIRKDEHASPYVTHPLYVARLIVNIGGITTRHILIAAILHDTLEDTSTAPDEIGNHFGEEVRSIVLELTDDKSLPKDRRKQLQVIHASHLSYPARIIKLADKLANCRDILHMPPVDWSLDRRRAYIQWAADAVAQIRDTNHCLEAAFDQMLADAEIDLDFNLEPFETVNDRPWGFTIGN